MKRLLVAMCAGMFSVMMVHAQIDSMSPKLAPPILKNQTSSIIVEVVDSSLFVLETKNKFPNASIQTLHKNIFKLHGVRSADIAYLVENKNVRYIDRADRRAHEETILGDFDFTVNEVSAVHSIYPMLTGNGFTLSIKEKPFDINDIDLKGRIKLNNQFDEPASLHATIMATIAAGAGNYSPDSRGVSPGAEVTTSDFDRLLPDDDSYFSSTNTTVQNHSYGVGVENFYGLESREFDRLCVRNTKLLHIFSSGNDGDKTSTEGKYAGIPVVANLTGQFKVSKNTISVGTVDHFGTVAPRSSRGPSYDGRVKPELVAFGDEGSSEAAAIVSGTAILLQDIYRQRYNELPDASLVKSVLVNSADDIGRPHVDFETGFGNLNALAAVESLYENRFFSGHLKNDEVQSYLIDLPADGHLLKITLAWNDIAAEPFNSKALINDLDLTVRNVQTNEIYYPWILDPTPSSEALTKVATRGADHLNNIEQVTIDLPQAGSYKITIHGYSIAEGVQNFSIAYGAKTGFRWIFPLNDNHLTANSKSFIRWEWNGSPENAILEYKLNSETEWTVVTTVVDLSFKMLEWNTPLEDGVYQLRLKIADKIYESETFSVSTPTRTKVGFDCDDQVLLQWHSVNNATSYKLFSLGEKYLEPMIATTDTFALIPKPTSSEYFSMAPVFNQVDGARELTINYKKQGVGCYFISVVPLEEIATTQAGVEVRLGSTYQLKSATLERWEGDNFVPLIDLAPVSALSFQLFDAGPVSGFNRYRVKLLQDNGPDIYSDTLEIFYVRENEIYLYPNPVLTGDDLNIVVSDESEVEMALIDVAGRVVKSSRDAGTVKTLSTENLVPGTYIVRVTNKNGLLRFGHVFVK